MVVFLVKIKGGWILYRHPAISDFSVVCQDCTVAMKAYFLVLGIAIMRLKNNTVKVVVIIPFCR